MKAADLQLYHDALALNLSQLNAFAENGIQLRQRDGTSHRFAVRLFGIIADHEEKAAIFGLNLNRICGNCHGLEAAITAAEAAITAANRANTHADRPATRELDSDSDGWASDGNDEFAVGVERATFVSDGGDSDHGDAADNELNDGENAPRVRHAYLSTAPEHTCSSARQRTAQSMRTAQRDALIMLSIPGCSTKARARAARKFGLKHPEVRNYCAGAFSHLIREEVGGLPTLVHLDSLHTFYTGEVQPSRAHLKTSSIPRRA